VIAVLIAILLPALGKAREQSRRTACLANLRTLGHAMIMYANDYKDRLPNTNQPPNSAYDFDAINYVLVALNRDYVKSPAVFHCPSDDDPVQEDIVTAEYSSPDRLVLNSARSSYDFYSVSWAPQQGPKLTRIKDAPLAWDLNVKDPRPEFHKNHGPGGGNVVFTDGHAEWQDVKEWDRANWPHPADRNYP
jgi:prepilin-type processing-associated H-X9-DG protein